MTQPTKPADLGPPLDLTDEQLDQAADITPLDIAAAEALWIHAAPRALKNLLDARRD